MIDNHGNPLAVGDHVRVIVIDPTRGAIHDLVQADARIVKINRTRVVLDVNGRTGTDAVGPECIRKV